MATALWQSALGAVAASLEGRPHRTCRDSLLLALEPTTGNGMAPATAKTSHKVLPATARDIISERSRHVCHDHALLR